MFWKSLAKDTGLYLWLLQFFITLKDSVVFIFLQSCAEKLLAWQGIEPTTLGIVSQAGSFDFSEMKTLQKKPCHTMPAGDHL